MIVSVVVVVVSVRMFVGGLSMNVAVVVLIPEKRCKRNGNNPCRDHLNYRNTLP